LSIARIIRRLPRAGPVARRSLSGAARRRHLAASARFAAIALLTAAVTLWLLDRALFDTPVLAPRLPVDYRGLPGEKLLLAARYPDAVMLYLGDSRVLFGISPTHVSETCGCGPGYNAAFAAADTRLTRVMADRVLEKLSPGVVVIGVSQWELSDAADIHVEGPAAELLPPWQWAEFGVDFDGRPEQLDQAVGAVWRLYRHRGEVRAALDPATTASAEEPRRGFYEFSGPTRVRGQDREQRRRQWFSDFSVHGRRAVALAGLLADLRGRGIRVVLVAPPFHPAFLPHVRREVDMFRAAVERLAADGGAAFVDLTEPGPLGLTPADFGDFVHLNKPAAREFSRHLGRLLQSRLAAG
jgi:hypothetical protein